MNWVVNALEAGGFQEHDDLPQEAITAGIEADLIELLNS